jgi:4-amino-4-deoxy-L-arabinose transferase-like glycosyltransferase
MLALNIASRSFGELLQPLDYNQVAPPLFLWIGRLAVVMGGTTELALRAWPALSGIALLPLLALVAYRLGGSSASLIAIAAAALSPTLIYYANEAKPYGSDAFVTALLLAAALGVREGPSPHRRWALLLAGGVVGLLLSIPAAFVLPAVLASLALQPGRPPARLRWLAGCAAVWGATLLGVYLAIYRAAARNPHQQEGYEMAFLSPGDGWLGRALLALRGTVWPTFAGMGSVIPVLPDWALACVAAVLVAGFLVLVQRGGASAGVLVGVPLVLAAAASALHRYPLGVPRMMVFASPLLILMAAAAVAALADRALRRVRAPFLVAAGVLCLVPSLRARVGEAREPWPGEDARSLVAAFRERPAAGEPVYVAARGLPSWLFYTTNWSRPDRDRLAFYARAASSGPSFENARSRAYPVTDEGTSLVYEIRGRKELLGLSSGRQWRWPTYVAKDVDEGWAANEARRIAQAADPCAWMYFTHLSERANKPVTWHLRDDHRGRLQTMIQAPGGVLYRYCFPRTPEQIQRMERWKAENGQ